MNLLDAHKIAHQYLNSVEKFGKLVISADVLPFYSKNWKEDLIHAFQIYLPYLILWHPCSQDQLNSITTSLMYISIIEEPDDAKALASAYEILDKRKSKIYARFHKAEIELASKVIHEHSEKVCSNLKVYPEEIEKTFNHMLEYYANNYLPGLNDKNVFDKVFCYTKEVYDCSGIEYKNGYDCYYITFDIMRKYLNQPEIDPEMSNYYKPYEDYLNKYDF